MQLQNFFVILAKTGGEKKKIVVPPVHREASALANELPQESDQFRFLRASCFANLKGAVCLIMTKVSAMRISIPLDLSSRSFIPTSRFIRSRRSTPFVSPSLVLFPPRSASAAHAECFF
jgi:hypothetical protein